MSVTTINAAVRAADEAAPLPPPSTFWKRFSRNPVAMVSLVVIPGGSLVLLAMAARNAYLKTHRTA